MITTKTIGTVSLGGPLFFRLPDLISSNLPLVMVCLPFLLLTNTLFAATSSQTIAIRKPDFQTPMVALEQYAEAILLKKVGFFPLGAEKCPGCFALGLLQTDLTARVKRGRSHRRRRLATSFGPQDYPLRGVVQGSIGRESHTRRPGTISDVYINISPFYGMAPATGRDTASAAAATPNG